MGKKKSVALIVIVTVVLLGLLFISITPTFPVKTPYSLQSLLNTVRLGADLGGGYGAVYYPEGVISAEEYAGEVARYESGEGTDPAEQYVANGGVYLDSEKVLDEKGKVDPAKLNAFVFDQFRNGYYAVGEKVGQAWQTGAKLMKK